ncbi:MAG: cobalt-zinc-cadmium efflux system outer membrane protein [Cognaticolwellia sp.]
MEGLSCPNQTSISTTLTFKYSLSATKKQVTMIFYHSYNYTKKPMYFGWLSLFLSLFFVLLNGSEALAQTSKVAQEKSTVNSLTLTQAIQQTLAKNPRLKAFKYRQQSLDGQQQTQALAPAYELGFDVENFAGTGQLNGIDGAEFTVSLSSVIEMADKREARIGVISERSVLLKAERKIETLTLLGEVTRRYIIVLSAQEQLLLAQASTALAKDTLQEVEKRSTAGITPVAEVKRAMAAVGMAKLTYSAQQQQLDIAKRALSMLWKENTPSFNLVEGSLYQFSNDIDFEQLFASVVQNPAIELFVSEQRLIAAQLLLARSQSSGDIKWSVGLRQNQEVDETSLVAGFSMPLFSGERNDGAIRAALAAKYESDARKEASLLKLHSQLYQSYSNRKQAIYTANNLKEHIIPLLEQTLNDAQSAYQSGRYSYLDYLTARQELLSAKLALIDSATLALRYGADIEQLTAEPLTTLTSSKNSSKQQAQGISQ